MAVDRKSFSKTWYRLRQLSRRLWIRAALIAGLAVIATFVAGPLSVFVPDELAAKLNAGSVIEILTILASSMLAVTIFSLSIMVSSRQAASSQVTPRSHQLLIEDTTTQTVLATFLGAFIFSLLGLIALSTGYYDGADATVMLAFTLLVIGLVVTAILRWIDHLSELGSVVETTRKVEMAAAAALNDRGARPRLGARALSPEAREIPAAAQAYRAWMTGYVQHIDVETLAGLADDGHASVYVVAAPGAFATKGAPLAWHTGDFADDDMREGFTMGETRVFGQDPAFGLIVLSEIAQRALSPGVNDPGTAIDVIGRLERLLLDFRCETQDGTDATHPRLWMRPVSAATLLRDAFEPIGRDGAGVIEVQVRLQTALSALRHAGDSALAAAARATAGRALARAEAALELPDDLARLHAAAGDLA